MSLGQLRGWAASVPDEAITRPETVVNRAITHDTAVLPSPTNPTGSTRGGAGMTSTGDLLAALCAHLAEFELPAIASVHAVASASALPVTVQLDCRAPSTIARGLLAWADTLAEVTAQAWRVPGGDGVHLSVTGLLPGGSPVRIYGGLRVTNRGPGTGLEPNATTTVALMTLRHLATPGQATEEVTV
ncbi:MAG: hypothetical protein ACRDRX_08735 [Pseudonocardiaceae bacterium]